jgi:hypothetical protein
VGVTSSHTEVLRVLQDRQPLTLTSLGELLICKSGMAVNHLRAYTTAR